MRTGIGMTQNDRVVAGLQFRHHHARVDAELHSVDHRAHVAPAVVDETLAVATFD